MNKIRSVVNYQGNMLLSHHVGIPAIHDLVVAPDETILRYYVWGIDSFTQPYWEL